MIAVCGVAITTLVLAAAGLADGGATIAGSPTVVFGEQVSGDSSTVSTDAIHDDFSLLRLTRGDRVTVDWQQLPPARLELDVYPVGTNDFDVASTKPNYQQEANGTNGRNELAFTATRSGVWPMAIADVHNCGSANCTDLGSPGQFTFTVRVKHVVRLTLAPLPPLRARSRIRVAVRNADGHAVTDANLTVRLWASRHGHRYLLGTSSARHGFATFTRLHMLSALHGKLVAVQAFARGAQYLSARSATQTTTAA